MLFSIKIDPDFAKLTTSELKHPITEIYFIEEYLITLVYYFQDSDSSSCSTIAYHKKLDLGPWAGALV